MADRTSSFWPLRMRACTKGRISRTSRETICSSTARRRWLHLRTCREAQSLFDYAALARTAQIAGALQSALERSIAYALERKQFGRPIGQFQAVQQQLALFGAETAAATCASRSAAIAASAGDASFQIAAAKLRANQAIGVATATAHQVHGAIGFTREYALRHATQRLWSWRSEYGNDRYWSEQLGRAVIERGADTFWGLYLTEPLTLFIHRVFVFVRRQRSGALERTARRQRIIGRFHLFLAGSTSWQHTSRRSVQPFLRPTHRTLQRRRASTTPRAAR